MGVDLYEVIRADQQNLLVLFPLSWSWIRRALYTYRSFYLTWKAREFGMHTRFIELAGEINSSMPDYVVSQTLILK